MFVDRLRHGRHAPGTSTADRVLRRSFRRPVRPDIPVEDGRSIEPAETVFPEVREHG